MKHSPDGRARLSLGATLTSLQRRRAAASGVAGGQGPMDREVFAPNPGGLEMLLYRPVGLRAGAPLVVVLHGCTQGAERFAGDGGWIALADRSGFAVLAPQQTSANNPNRCFNWFQAEDMHRGGGEPASIAAMITHAVQMHDLDPDRVYVTGLSAGGAMTAVMLAAYPELFAGGAIIAGAPYGAARSVPQAFQTMQGRGLSERIPLAALLRESGAEAGTLPPLAIWHGDADHVVNAGNADDIVRQWGEAQGLAEAPDEVNMLEGHVRSLWRDKAGEVRIEMNRVPGMGHGVPLETRGAQALGRAAPYMLQAGVSSTLEIARFWGLETPAAQDPAARSTPGAAEPRPASRPEGTPVDPPGVLGAQVMTAVSGVPAHIQDVIAGTLTRAGLLK